MRRLLILIFTVSAFAKAEICHSQKVEREYRMDRSQVPQEVQNFVNAFISYSKIKSRIKWIQEESEQETSIEAKFKLEGARYSIEFSKSGDLEDVEVVASFSKLPIQIKKKIQSHVRSQFTHFKVEKTQLQYIASPENILQWRANQTGKDALKPSFEIVIKTRNSGESSKRYQFQFDEKGNFLAKVQIVERRDNILRF